MNLKSRCFFCIGRRTHRLARFEDLDNPVQRDYARSMCDDLGVTVNNMDEIIDEIMQRFV